MDDEYNEEVTKPHERRKRPTKKVDRRVQRDRRAEREHKHGLYADVPATEGDTERGASQGDRR